MAHKTRLNSCKERAMLVELRPKHQAQSHRQTDMYVPMCTDNTSNTDRLPPCAPRATATCRFPNESFFRQQSMPQLRAQAALLYQNITLDRYNVIHVHRSRSNTSIHPHAKMGSSDRQTHTDAQPKQPITSHKLRDGIQMPPLRRTRLRQIHHCTGMQQNSTGCTLRCCYITLMPRTQPRKTSSCMYTQQHNKTGFNLREYVREPLSCQAQKLRQTHGCTYPIKHNQHRLQDETL